MRSLGYKEALSGWRIKHLSVTAGYTVLKPPAAGPRHLPREFARHRIRRVSYIGVPRAVVERRMQHGQLIGGPQARVPLYVPYADFFQYQAGAGRLAGRA